MAMNFYKTVSAAIADITLHGYDSEQRVAYWTQQIRDAALRDLAPPGLLQKALDTVLLGTYSRLVEKRGALKVHSGLKSFTLDQIKPKLRAELDRRIMASANLIKLNRQKSIETTLSRFQGWATSIPIGGSQAVNKTAAAQNVRKALASLPFEERRVAIDQGHKLTSAINEIIATDGGAIAAIWHSHWRQKNYDYREPHKEVDEKVFLVRGSWAHKAGLVKPGKVGYTDDIERPAELPYCRCYYQYIYSLRALPPDMLTAKGRAKLAEVRAKLAVS